MSTTAPFGTWPSPITPGTIMTRTVLLSQVHVDGADTYWVKQRTSQAGRDALLRRNGDGQIGEVLPLTPANKLVDVRTRVHEYGGRAYVVDSGIIVVSHTGDGRLYRYDVIHCMRGLVPLTIYGDVRHGDLEIDTGRGLVYAVREDHRGGGEVVNTLVATPLDGSAARDDSRVHTLVSGTDPVVALTLSPDDEHLAWVTWNHPGMPWDNASLHVGGLGPDGTLGEQTLVDGGSGHSVSEPRWTEECELVHDSNASGFWNLYRTKGFPVRGINRTGWSEKLRTRPLHPAEATFTNPASWQLGPHSFNVLGSEHIITSWVHNAVSHLGTIKLANGELEEWNVGWQPIGSVASNAGRVATLASNEISMSSIVEAKNGTVKVLHGSGKFMSEGTGVSFPEPVSWPASDGATAHGFYYPPTSTSHTSPNDELAPLVVNAHGGPTAMTIPGYDLRIQCWTSRGFGYLDVNYRGSMGYGTGYRKALEGKWGIYDVDDYVNGVQHLVDAGLVDPRRITIHGDSAGGFMMLSAITRSSVPMAASSRFGVTNLKRLVCTTHKSKSHYIGQPIGTQDIDAPMLDECSPINHIGDIDVPLLLIQGSGDPIVPAEQATAMYEALKEIGAPVALEVFQGEGHSFRLATNIRRRYEAELNSYRQVQGIDADSSHVKGQGEEETFTVKVENLN